MAYNELSEDLHLNPNSWTAAIMFSVLIGILSISIILVWDILIYQEFNLARTLQSGIAFIVILTLLVRSTVALRAGPIKDPSLAKGLRVFLPEKHKSHFSGSLKSKKK